ncbi:MAG: flagellar basal body L-ring protein FlgH [Phycisphaeraceae bacterium]|nr:flagellar basal body L-ring protein FlgH [Phycisphaeraceae bacterium]
MSLMKWVSILVIAVVVSSWGSRLYGQTSSLYVTEVAVPAPKGVGNNPVDRLSPALSSNSLAAVKMPEPRKFAMYDLVTIIIRESTESDSESTLDTKKESKYDGEVSAFPNLQLAKLLQFQLEPSSFSNGNPSLGVNFKSNFKGDGSAKRSDTFTSRITARIIDVKPNGTIVIEARKFIQSDKETLEMVLSGTCRKEDITIDNTILSTQIYDLNLKKIHKGELRNTAKKGFITKVLDGIFNF